MKPQQGSPGFKAELNRSIFTFPPVMRNPQALSLAPISSPQLSWVLLFLGEEEWGLIQTGQFKREVES